MKKKILFIIILGISNVLFCQSTNETSFQSIITIGINNNYTSFWGNQDERGFINGILFGDSTRRFIGSSKNIDFGFIGNLSETYWYHKENPKSEITEELYKQLYTPNNNSKRENSHPLFLDAEKLVYFSFCPEKIQDKDSLKVYCKYIIFEKENKIGFHKYNYNISFKEEFFHIPLDKEVSLDFLKKLFPEASVNTAVFSIGKNLSAIKQSTLDLSKYQIKSNDIKESIKKNFEEGSKLKISAEYVRIKKNDDEILVRAKFDCSGKKYIVHPESVEELDYPLCVYQGAVETPFSMYNASKVKLFQKSKLYGDSKIKYSLSVIPLDHKGNKYTFKLIINRGIWNGMSSYSKLISIEVGKPIRIYLEAAGGLYRNDEVIDGKRLNLSLKDDFANYVDESIIIQVNKND